MLVLPTPCQNVMFSWQYGVVVRGSAEGVGTSEQGGAPDSRGKVVVDYGGLRSSRSHLTFEG